MFTIDTLIPDIFLITQLIQDEGTGPFLNDRFFPYKDTVGKLTIGIGRNLDDKGLSKDEVELMLRNDIREMRNELTLRLPWFTKLNAVRQAVFINMAFNLGVAGLLSFKNTLGMAEQGNFIGTKNGMLNSKWASQVGARAIRLANMMETGKL